MVKNDIQIQFHANPIQFVKISGWTSNRKSKWYCCCANKLLAPIRFICNTVPKTRWFFASKKKTGGSKTLIPTRSSQRIDLIFSTTSLTYYIYIQLISGRCHVYIDADSSMQCEHNLKVAGKVSCGGGTYPPEFELSTRYLCSYFLKLF